MVKKVKEKSIGLKPFLDVEQQTMQTTTATKEIFSVVACKEKGSIQSAEQKKFATLSKKVEKLKKELKAIPEKEQEIRKFYSEKIEPGLKEYSSRMKENLKELDRWHEQGKLTTQRREIVSIIILEICEELLCLEINSEEDTELITSYRYKYTERQTGLTTEEQKQQELEEMSTMIEELFGIEMDEKMKSASNIEELIQQLQEKMQEMGSNNHTSEKEEERTHSDKKATKKELEKQMREQQEVKSLRNIYIELVNEFHPDKEQDEVTKLKKEEQFKKITEAYRNKDIFALLTMQLNWIEESELALENQSNDTLKQYNKLMKKQLDQLQNQFEEQINRPLWGLPMNYSKLLSESGRQLKQSLKELEWEKDDQLFEVFRLEVALQKKRDLNRFLDEKEKTNQKNQFEDIMSFILNDLDDFDDLDDFEIFTPQQSQKPKDRPF